MLHDVCGLQAQLLSAAALGIRARTTGLRQADITRAINDERSIVRTWLMRGTLHLIAAEDLGLMLGLLGRIVAAGKQSRHTQLGLDSDLKRRGVIAIRRILSRTGPLTRYEIVERLRRHGITLDRKTQAPIHLIQLAALEGILCLGPDREKTREPTYVLIDDWLEHPPSPPNQAALGELARRYFAAYGPAAVDDLVAWSGLPVTQARLAITMALPALAQVKVDGRACFALKERIESTSRRSPGTKTVRLLPAFDSYLLGYQSRDLAVPSRLQRRLQRGGGWLHPAVVIDGRAVGAWSFRKAGGQTQVLIETLEPIEGPLQEGVEAEVADVGRFLGMPLTVRKTRLL
ncbi:MAG: winged helix DNA-binding domain-containing protein [Chloroflexi bacterium]|nr:MAG: winged helix DNA-binding domain-containing protein [Chloroflexota bacterium]